VTAMPRTTAADRRRRRRAALQASGASSFRATDAASRVTLTAEAGTSTTAAPPFTMLAYTGGRLLVPIFDVPAVVLLSGLTVPRSTPILLDHDKTRRVGHVERVENDGRALRVSGRLSAATPAREEVIESARANFPWQASIGVQMQAVRRVAAGQTIEANGQTFTGPLVLVTSATLREISFVSVGADETGTDATIHAAAAAALSPSEGRSMTFEQWLTAQGFTAADLTDPQRTFLRATYDAEQLRAAAAGSPTNAAAGSSTNAAAGSSSGAANNPANTAPAAPLQAAAAGTAGSPTNAAAGSSSGAANNPANTAPAAPLQAAAAHATATPDQLLATMRAEHARVHGIEQLCAQFGDPTFTVNNQTVELRAHAIAEGWDLQRTELEARREARGGGPAIHSRSHTADCTLQALQGSLLLRCGLRLDDPAWTSPAALAMGHIPAWLRAGINDQQRQQAMEAAHRYAGMSLLDLAREAVWLDGRDAPYNRDAMLQAAFSGGTLSHLFTSNVSASVLAAFAQFPDTTRGWVAENPNIPNFKTHEKVRLEMSGGLKKLPRGKTAEHGSVEDTGESYKIARYAKQLVIDDQDMIDDNLDLFAQFPRDMGRDAARLRPDLVYGILLRNPAMADGVALFHADHGNLKTNNAFAASGLQALLTQLGLIQENGVNLNLMATHLIVPQTLKFTADQLLRSPETRAAAASGGPTANPLLGYIANIVADARLDNGLTDPDTGTAAAGSTTDYYILDANYPPIEVGTLAGSGGVPRLRRTQFTGEGRYGMSFDINHDIGAKAIRAASIHKAEA